MIRRYVPSWPRRRDRQLLLAFRARAERRERQFRRSIVALTGLLVLGILAGTPRGRDATLALASRGKWRVLRALGREPPRGEVDALWRRQRSRGVAQAADQFRRVYRGAGAPLRELLRVAGMAPGEGLLRWANHDWTLLFSARVFAPDGRRSYRLRPRTRAVWLRHDGLAVVPFGMLLVPDTADVRAAASAAGAAVVPGSAQATNSWGCRGPEPDPAAPLRGIVLGDSFMQGLFLGDHESPPACLQRALQAALGMGVSVLNTGHFGYSPEQYYYTLREYGDRFRPRFVVVSVCPNDFGDGFAVMEGRGDWGEAGYWLDRIRRHCEGRGILCILAPVPCDFRLEGRRLEGFFPGMVANACNLDSLTYCNPFEDFVDEHLRLVREGLRRGVVYARSPLYNRAIGDGHFSARGAEVWGRALARRVALLLETAADPTVARTTRGLAPRTRY